MPEHCKAFREVNRLNIYVKKAFFAWKIAEWECYFSSWTKKGRANSSKPSGAMENAIALENIIALKNISDVYVDLLKLVSKDFS